MINRQKFIRLCAEWLVFLGALALALIVVSWWQTRDMLDTSGEVIIAPLTLPTLKGEVGVISPDQHRNTLIYFFAPWCSICRASIGNLATVDEEITQVVVIALDYATIENVQKFVEETALEKTVYLGTEEVRELFKIKGYPSYYILDTHFRVVSRDMGYSTGAGLKARTWQNSDGDS